MVDSNLLSFCIPTYNNAEYLRKTLPNLIVLIKKFGFKIIISDNGSTDSTLDVVNENLYNYDRIVYLKLNENIGPDKNFENALKTSQSDYSILLGTTYEIIESQFSNLLNILCMNKYDVVFLNAFDRIKSLESKEYNNSTDILEQIGWHISLLPCTIFGKRVIQTANFKRYYNSFFIQNGIVFEYFENNKTAKAYWYSYNCISSIPKKSVWFKDIIAIFGKKWTEFVLSLPASIPLDIKLSCIKEHGVKAQIFNIKNLIIFREIGYISYKNYIDYYIYFPYIMKRQSILFFKIVVSTPKFFFKAIRIFLGKNGLH